MLLVATIFNSFYTFWVIWLHEFPFKINKTYEDVRSTNFANISHGWRIEFPTSTRWNRIVRKHRASKLNVRRNTRRKAEGKRFLWHRTRQMRREVMRNRWFYFPKCAIYHVARETTVVTGFVIPATHGAAFIIPAELVIPYATQIRTYFMVHNERPDCNGREDVAVKRRTKWRRDSKPNGTASSRDARCGDTFPRNCPSKTSTHKPMS